MDTLRHRPRSRRAVWRLARVPQVGAAAPEAGLMLAGAHLTAEDGAGLLVDLHARQDRVRSEGNAGGLERTPVPRHGSTRQAGTDRGRFVIGPSRRSCLRVSVGCTRVEAPLGGSARLDVLVVADVRTGRGGPA